MEIQNNKKKGKSKSKTKSKDNGTDLQSQSSSKGFVEDLPTGVIVGLMVIGDPLWVDEYDVQKGKNKWLTGPLAYKIIETVSLPIEAMKRVRGNTCAFHIDVNTEKEILSCNPVKAAIGDWYSRYGSKLSPLWVVAFSCVF